MNKKNAHQSKQSLKKEQPRAVDPVVAPASKTIPAVGPADLKKLSSDTLYKLLQLKNVSLRSKIRKKGDRVAVLAGTVSLDDLLAAGVDTTGISPGVPIHPAATAHDERRDVIRPGDGKRLDLPVGGIDVHSKILWVAIATPQGIIWTGTFDNTAGGIEDMIRKLRHHGVAHVAMESTAEYWLKPYWALDGAGIEVLVANAMQVAASQGKKTDRLDAGRLALAFRDGRLKPSVLCTPEQFRMRKLNREATKQVENATAAISRARRMLEHHDAPEWLANLSKHVRARRVLARALKPGARPHLLRIVTEEHAMHRGAITRPDILVEMAKEVGDLLSRMKNKDERMTLAMHLDDYKHFQASAEEKRNALLAMIREDERMVKYLRLLVSIPCVSIATALTLLVEIVDVRFFWRSESLVKWAGMAPRVNQSGVKKRKTGRIRLPPLS